MIGRIVDSQSQIWVSDFTYLPYFGKFLYLATVEDIFTRQIIGWEISVKHDSDLVTKALLKALFDNSAPLIVHSDQGSEYRSKEHLDLLKSFDILPSMSPWQNGEQESFYSGFKLELGHPEIYPTIGELIEAIGRQIYYYNNLRIHTALKCPPVVFAKRCAGMLKNKAKGDNLIISNQDIEVRLSV